MDLGEKIIERINDAQTELANAVTYFGKGDYQNAVDAGEKAKALLDRAVKYIRTAEDADDGVDSDEGAEIAEELTSEEMAAEALETGDGDPD